MPIIMMSDSGTDPTEQYDAIISKLDAGGHGHPQGRLLHLTAEKANGGYFVIDLWESQEALDRFAQVLVPFIEQAGGDLPALQVSRLHDLIVDDPSFADAATQGRCLAEHPRS
jgi:hypothetical protein